MSFNKTRAERIVSAAMTMLPSDLGDGKIDYGITIRATPETIEALKQSDSPFAGYVISCMTEDPIEGKAHFDDWMNRSIEATMAELDLPGAVTYSLEEVMGRINERIIRHKAVLARLRETFTPEEIELLGVIIHEEDDV